MVNINGFPVCVFRDFLELEELLEPAENRIHIILFKCISLCLYLSVVVIAETAVSWREFRTRCVDLAAGVAKFGVKNSCNSTIYFV